MKWEIGKKEKKDERVCRSLFSVRKYLFHAILLAVGIVVTFLAFGSNIQFDYQDFAFSTSIALVDILLISLLFTIVDGMRRKMTMERPMSRILAATRRLTEGDFSARIKPFHSYSRRSEWDVIIEDFNKMAEELSGIETLRTGFISDVSHEIKTPLAVIDNYAAALQQENLTEEQRLEYTKVIAQASSRLNTLITNILKLNKLENQQIYPEVREFDLGSQLCDCILNFEDALDEKNLEVETDIAERVFIHADAELLSLVWNNLLSNAIKFTQERGTIRVSLKEDRDWVVAKVADNGCGMTPEVSRHIFEKFYQGDQSHSTPGNGLGLALVKRVVDIVGGGIQVESAPLEGSTFIVTLPKKNHESQID